VPHGPAFCVIDRCTLPGILKCQTSPKHSCGGNTIKDLLSCAPTPLKRTMNARQWWLFRLPPSVSQVDLPFFFNLGVFSCILVDYVHVRSVNQCDDELANVSLIKAGYLGGSPVQPMLAVSLECLELYHQIRRRKPSFSVQAMVKVLCALHNVSLEC
jgi:hypothetical protein